MNAILFNFSVHYWFKNTKKCLSFSSIFLKCLFADFRHEYCICIISTLPFAPPTRPTFFPAPPLHIEASSLLLLLSYVLTELLISVWFSFFLVDSLGFHPLIRMPCVSRNRCFFFSSNLSGFYFPSCLAKFTKTSSER